MVLELGLLASGALIDAVKAHGDGTTPMLDGLLGWGMADGAHGAILANEASHGGDGPGEHPLLSLALNIALLDAIHRLLVHDDHIGTADKLDDRWVGESIGLEHRFPRLEGHILMLHRRNSAIEAQSAKGHASFSTRGTAKRRKIVRVPIGPAFGVVNQIDQALLFHDEQQ